MNEHSSFILQHCLFFTLFHLKREENEAKLYTHFTSTMLHIYRAVKREDITRDDTADK